MQAVFISDLHLHAEQPETQQRAVDFLEAVCNGTTSLYILGDLFDVWVGDDDPVDWAQPFLAALSAASHRGTAVHLMHGNRDFLLGETFAARIGATLHTEDQLIIEVAGTRALIMHGDTLCTDDTRYQSVRSRVRGATWQRDFLQLPLAERQHRAAGMRDESRAANAAIDLSLTDANSASCERALTESGAALLIHGHTHRPATHPCGHGERIVLGEWLPDGGQYALITERGATLTHWPPPQRP